VRVDLLAPEKSEARRRRALGALALAAVAAAAWMLGARRTTTGPSAISPPSPAPAAAAATVAPPAVTATVAATATSPASASGALKTRPLSTWLADVARDAERELVISPDLRGDLTASESSDLPWRQRLEAYSRVFGFEFTVDEGLIEVTRATAARERPESSTTAAAPEASGPSAAAAATGGTGFAPGGDRSEAAPPSQTRVVRLAYSAAKETAAVLGQAGKALDVTVSADPSSNALVLSGPSDALARVIAVLRELDRPRRRILLDAKIVEVTRSARLDLGVEWRITGTKVGGDVRFPVTASEAGSAALLIATGGASALDARISALEASGKLHVVSRPSVVMMEGSPATIESARILRIRLPNRGALVGDEVVESPSSGRATEEIPVGVRLEVTPAIRGGGRVLLRIKAKSSSLGAPLPPDDIPEELSRMVDAEVLVTSGETAVLGGLTRESGSKSGSGVPGLRRVPLAGSLFGKKSDDREEEELLVIVTPRVLD
jgi:hypothetical protein